MTLNLGKLLTSATWYLLATFIVLGTCNAVGPTGRIVGTVTDPAGSVLPGARVVVTNLGTGENRTDTSDQNGDFTFPAMSVGNYSVRVEKDGFESYVQRGIVLEVDQNVSVRAALTVGSLSETVEVTSGAQTINLVDATVSHVVDQRRVRTFR